MEKKGLTYRDAGVGELPRFLLRLRFLRLERGDLFAKRVGFVAGHLQLALQLRHA